jgi:hypothetical protein
MKWKKRAAEIARLKAKHGRDRSLARSFPDLSIEPRTAPMSNRLDYKPLLKKEALKVILGPEFMVEHLHKSGYQVFSVKDLPNLGGKKI